MNRSEEKEEEERGGAEAGGWGTGSGSSGADLLQEKEDRYIHVSVKAFNNNTTQRNDVTHIY